MPDGSAWPAHERAHATVVRCDLNGSDLNGSADLSIPQRATEATTRMTTDTTADAQGGSTSSSDFPAGAEVRGRAFGVSLLAFFAIGWTGWGTGGGRPPPGAGPPNIPGRVPPWVGAPSARGPAPPGTGDPAPPPG